DRRLLLQSLLLPRAERRSLRDRHDRTRLTTRRACRAPGGAPLAAARFRAPAGPGRTAAHAVAEPTRLGSSAVRGRFLLLLPLLAFCLLAAVSASAGSTGTHAASPTTIS